MIEITDWRDMPEDWDFNDALDEMGIEVPYNALLIMNKTYLNIAPEDYDSELKEFRQQANEKIEKLPEHIAPYKIIITDTSFHLLCLVGGQR